MSTVISKRFKDYIPSLVSYIAVLPAAVKPSNLKDIVYIDYLSILILAIPVSLHMQKSE